MQTFGIVALSILAGLFLALLFLGLGVLLWAAFQMKRGLADMRAREASIHAETQQAMEISQNEILRISGEYAAKLKSELEAARSAFSGIRSEVKVILEDHNRRTLTAIEKINGDALAAAVKRNIDASVKLEKTVSLLQNWLIGTVAQNGNTYGPEDYAPEETNFGTPSSEYSVNATASLDAKAEQEAIAEVTTDAE